MKPDFNKWCHENGVFFKGRKELDGGRRVFDAMQANHISDATEAKRLIREMLKRLEEVEL